MIYRLTNIPTNPSHCKWWITSTSHESTVVHFDNAFSSLAVFIAFHLIDAYRLQTVSTSQYLHHSAKQYLHHIGKQYLHHIDKQYLHHIDKQYLHHIDNQYLHHIGKVLHTQSNLIQSFTILGKVTASVHNVLVTSSEIILIPLALIML